jgi:mRNA interferase HicA
LLKAIALIAADHDGRWEFVREGAEHEVWEMNGQQIYIPRHREINELTARGIIRRAERAARERR